MGVNNLPKVTT